MDRFTIAVDGPSGAGKSTVAKLVAEEFQITYLDTGAMYRAAAVKAAACGADPSDEERVLPIIQNTDIDIVYENGVQKVFLDGEDVSVKIREHAVSKAASDISKIEGVRKKLVDLQRGIARGKSVIMDGRDIASHVLPDADVKIYLTASSSVRARRRYDELIARNQPAVYEDILKDIEDRDYNDMNRSVSPLICVADAARIDCSQMSIPQVVCEIARIVRQKLAGTKA